MAVFDGKNRVPRGVVDPRSDHLLPKSHSLSWKAIATDVALAGTKGTHCEVIRGDQWSELKDNHILNIARDQTIKVVGKHKETLVRSCYQNIVGPHIVQNNNVRNETRLARFNLVYGDNEITSTKDGDISLLGFATSIILATDFEVATLKCEFTPIHVELKLLHCTASNTEILRAGTNLETYTLSVQAATSYSLQYANTSCTYNVQEIEMHAAGKVEMTAANKVWLGSTFALAGVTVGQNAML